MHFNQVITNLLTNAATYGGTEVALTTTSKHGGATVSVAENGPGAEPDFVQYLVDRFARSAAARKGLVSGVIYFTTKAGQPQDRTNVGKAMRRVFKVAEVQWVGTHTFGRTVASWLDAAGGPLAEIANQLGHADINVAATYLGRATAPTRAAEVMVLPTSKPRLRSIGGEQLGTTQKCNRARPASLQVGPCYL